EGAQNPSSLHACGREARAALERAREAVSVSMGANAGMRLVFTASGTEANNMALKCFKWDHVLVGATEHASVRFVREEAGVIPVDARGLIDMDALCDMLAERTGRILVSVMAANNETGVIADLPAIGRIVHERGAYLHADAAQAYGKTPFSAKEAGAD